MEGDLSNKLHRFFYPRSVAVIGASANPGKWGYGIMSRLVNSRCTAKIYPVHRTSGEVLGLKAYPNLLRVPDVVDLAVIVIPPHAVPQAMTECVAKGVEAAIVITAGFRETGTQGRELEKDVLRIARGGGVRFAGPNCNGHFNTAIDLFTAEQSGIGRGGLGVISQSGNFGTYLVERGTERGAGFSKYVSSGNEADLTLEDYLEYLGEDEETRIICAYIEGVKDGRRFFDVARRISRKKPLLIMKVGRSEEGARATLSHTGSLSGADAVHDAALRQAGALRVDDVDELLNAALALRGQPLPRGRRVGIITSGGGFGVIATDACRHYGLEVPALAPETVRRLDKYLVSRWSHANPVDMAGDTWGAFGCIGNLLKTDYIDAVLAVGSVGFPTDALQTGSHVTPDVKRWAQKMVEEEVGMVDGLIERVHKNHKPLIITTTIGGDRSPALARLREKGIHTYRTPRAGAQALSYLVKYARYLGRFS